MKEPKGQQIAWIGGYNDVYEAQVTTDEAADFCADSSQYDYCYDEGCASSLYEFKNINCERLPYYEAYKKTQSESGYIFYVPTFFKRENRDTQLVTVFYRVFAVSVPFERSWLQRFWYRGSFGPF